MPTPRSLITIDQFDDVTLSDLATMPHSIMATYVETTPSRKPCIDEDESDCGVWLARLLSR